MTDFAEDRAAVGAGAPPPQRPALLADSLGACPLGFDTSWRLLPPSLRRGVALCVAHALRGLCVDACARAADAAAADDAADDKTLRVMLAGGIAGCISKTITAPLARLTILYQVRRAVRPRLAVAPLHAARLGCFSLARRALLTC